MNDETMHSKEFLELIDQKKLEINNLSIEYESNLNYIIYK